MPPINVMTEEQRADPIRRKRESNERLLKLMEQSKHPAANGHRAG